MNIRIFKLMQSPLFSKQGDKTQVLIAGEKRGEFYKTRQSHVLEVSGIALLIAKQIGFKKVDEVNIVCLSHDLGHCPFGHDGQKILNAVSKEYGIEEGFSDNNNNFNVIWNNGLELSLYEQVSLIKYPSKLYSDQKDKLLPALKKAVKKESKAWGENLSRTVACEIMDFSDEIAYGTSDLLDGHLLNFTTGNLELFLIEQLKISQIYTAEISLLLLSLRTQDNRLFKETVFELKMKMIKDSIWDFNKSKMSFKSKESTILISKIIKFNAEYFIHNKIVEDERKEAMKKLEAFSRFYFENPEMILSKLYRTKIEQASSQEEKLCLIRDMIADTSDQYVLSFEIPA